jgi:pre-mRNA-splicing factor 38B|tara:strand:+ start:1236 stop:1640 length:405 start_codon:yes stop_codon:yes gene_type:complete|eukprot:31545-Pelagococcus_subviridis.AAC.6
MSRASIRIHGDATAMALLGGQALDNGKSYNMEKVLRTNILASDYFSQLVKMNDFYELVDEIYNEVDHVEPWMSGNARGPSTAFCLLYRLFTMEIEDNEVKHLINHGDSPYIRALGFLYVRYVLHTGPHTTPFAW